MLLEKFKRLSRAGLARLPICLAQKCDAASLESSGCGTAMALASCQTTAPRTAGLSPYFLSQLEWDVRMMVEGENGNDASFSDRLTARLRAVGHPLCLGLDPYIDRIPSMFGGASEADTTRNFLLAYLDLAAARVAIVKPQISLFERLGPNGMEVLHDVVEQARRLGALVLLDAKRGDIGPTAQGYAEAYLDPAGFLNADAITVSPYMGLDSVEPFVAMAEQHGKGVVVLVRNSNPGAEAIQTWDVGGAPLFERVAESLTGFERRLMGRLGWSSLGVTVSALAPDDSLRVRARLPSAWFLTLGYATQGGSAAAAVAGLKRTVDGFEGGVVNNSRALLFPTLQSECDGAAWERAVSGSLSASIASFQTLPGCGSPQT